ncbi:GBS Bsp-like repeat-containing protein, partial [Enterococcus sp. LJL99]
GGAFKTDIYGTVDGKLQKLNEAKYELELVNVNVVKMTSISKTQMKITISNPNGGNVTRVQFPTWSMTNGQDDIKWLEGTRETDGSWSVVVNSSEYKHAGAFKTDIYGTVNGKMQKLGDANYTLEAPAENTVETKSISSTKMQVTIFNPNGGNVTRVQFPTWSTTNGQDDIKWLEGTRNTDGSWSVVVNSSEYKHAGAFKTDIYGTVNGKMQKLGGANYTLEALAENTVETKSISNTKMQVTIFNPNGGNVTRVQFPTWSTTNGQDDIKWLEGTRNSNGSWSVIVDSSEYKHGGAFKTDIYGTVNGKLQKLGGSSYTLVRMIQTHLFVMGHGGWDPGAVGNGTNEREFTRNELLPVFKKYAAKLKESTLSFYDPSRDMYQDSKAGNGAYKISADIASVTEVHLDAGGIYSTGGHVIITPGAKTKENINVSSVIKANVGWNSAYAYNQGLSERTDLLNLNVFKQRNIPYRLTELGFITNANDVNSIRRNKEQICKQMIEQVTGEKIQ